MNRLYFWKGWHQPYKNLYWLFFILFLLAFLSAIYNYFIGLNYVIHWELIDKLDQLSLVVHTVNVGNFKFEIPVDNYVIFQYFEGSNLIINAYNAYIYLFFLAISVNLIMAVLPSMPKIWFYVGMGGFIGFAVMLNIDQIMLFGQMDKTALIIVLALYLSAGYYFKEINKNLNLQQRFIIFNILSVILAILFYMFAGVPDPFLYISNYGIFASIIITVFFIILIAHEIIFGFLYLITNSNTIGSKNSLQHFTVISLFYLVYVGITYLHYSGQIDWDLIYLNPFLLAGITIIIGIWGYKRREDLFKEIFRFYPVGAFFYLGFGIITISTFSYIFADANDPLIDAFEEVILYSQIGFGIMYFIYVLTNFGPLLLKNMKVAKVAYQSRVLPFFVFRVGGLLIFGYIFYSSYLSPYYQSMAGYYNFIGDIFYIEYRLDLAEEYYKEASVYDYQNHRSNYAMATLSRLKRNKNDEAYYLNNALLRQPTEFAYANLSNTYLHNDQYFEGLFKLKDAMKVYPYSYHLLNNSGFYYSRTDIADSAFYYFDQSDKSKWNSKVPASNIYGLLAKANINISIDSLEDEYNIKGSYAGKANKLAMQNQFGERMDQSVSLEIEDDFKTDYFAFIYNNGLHQIKSSNTAFYKNLVNYADTSGIDLYVNRIMVLSSLNLYFNHQVTESFRLLYDLGEMSVFNDVYFNMLGILALDAGSPRLAIDYFQRTSTQINEKYRLNLALAYAEAGLLNYAREIFQSLSQSADASIQAISKEYLSIFNWDNRGDLDSLNDEQKYLLLHFRYNAIDPVMSDKLFESIKNNHIKQLIRIERIEYIIGEGKMEEALQLYNIIDFNNLRPELDARLKKLEYLLAIYERKGAVNMENPGNLATNDPFYLYDQLLYVKGKEVSKDTLQADSVYNVLATWDPFFEAGVIASVNYFDAIRKKDNYAYNLMVNALTVNMYSISLNKYYIEYCVNDGLIDFARNRLEFMKEFMVGDVYNEYFEAASMAITKKEIEMNAWGS